MENTIVIERLFNAPKSVIWQALTDVEELKSWFFQLQEFKAETGFKFQFLGGHKESVQYLHLCEVTEVIPFSKLTYSWRYEGLAGISFVSFELQDLGTQTLLRLSHSGIDSFPKENPHFAMANFSEGWNQIINVSLQQYLNKKHFHLQITTLATAQKVYKSLTGEIPHWWTEMFEGSARREGDQFTVRFGTAVFKTMQVEALTEDKKVAWRVTDTLIDLPELNNKTEWLGTEIIWDIAEAQGKTVLTLTHIGLIPEIECYAICENGWRTFVNSLVQFLETGTGQPFKNS